MKKSKYFSNPILTAMAEALLALDLRIDPPLNFNLEITLGSTRIAFSSQNIREVLTILEVLEAVKLILNGEQTTLDDDDDNS